MADVAGLIRCGCWLSGVLILYIGCRCICLSLFLREDLNRLELQSIVSQLELCHGDLLRLGRLELQRRAVIEGYHISVLVVEPENGRVDFVVLEIVLLFAFQLQLVVALFFVCLLFFHEAVVVFRLTRLGASDMEQVISELWDRRSSEQKLTPESCRLNCNGILVLTLPLEQQIGCVVENIRVSWPSFADHGGDDPLVCIK